MTNAQGRRLARERIERAQAEARRVVSIGICPDCGTRLIRNLALAGWWQCGAYACEDFRKAEFKGLPKCHFQTFTE